MSDPASALRLEEVTVGVETMLTRVRAGKLSMAAVSMGLADTADTLRALLAATEPAPEPVSNAYTLPEEVEAIIRSVAEHDCRCSLFADIGIFCDPCRARAFLAARGGRP